MTHLPLPLRLAICLVCAIVIGAVDAIVWPAAVPHGTARIFILMVWDGLRPDMVTQSDTPNLFALEREGVRFDHHHSSYPTQTMVNAAVLATGADPGVNGIVANTLFLGPLLNLAGTDPAEAELKKVTDKPLMLENSTILRELNGPTAFHGHLLQLDTAEQQVERQGGYLAVIGKQGPAFLFDDRVAENDGAAPVPASNNYLFVSDDLTEPKAEAASINAGMPPMLAGTVPVTTRDSYFASLVANKALPAAKLAAQSGKPAIVVFWQHDPDITQHVAGLGTMANIAALRGCDANLGTIRRAIRALGIENKTDLMVVSDHGFATIRMRVALTDLLVGMGLKKSADSTDVVVAANSGSDLIYVDRAMNAQARHDLLQKIVNFAAPQEWCGPIFSQQPAAPALTRVLGRNYAGGIDGTLSEAVVHVSVAGRSPDLMISFREVSDTDNADLTGPNHRAFVLGSHGQQSVLNNSQPLIRPVMGVLYADTGGNTKFTSGMGTHGAVGARELHNFCAAIGPDFRRSFVDLVPSGNVDVAPTISWLLGLEMNVGPGAYPTGRVLREAVRNGAGAPASSSSTASSSLQLQGMRVLTTLTFARAGDRDYLDDVNIQHIPLGRSP